MKMKHCSRGWALLLVLLAGGLLLPIQTTHAQTAPTRQTSPEPPDLATYERWLREALAAAQRNDRLSLELVAENLTSTNRVQGPDGSPIPVHNAWLQTALEAPDPDLSEITTRLGALLDALIRTSHRPPADAQQRLEAILSNPPFAERQVSSDTWLTRFLDWLVDVLERLFSPAAEAGGSSVSLVNLLIITVCCVLLALVLFYLVNSLRTAMVGEARATPDDDPEANLSASDAFEQAGVLASGGDYRTAVRYLYLSSLLWLEEQGMLRYDRALTNREYLANLADRPDLRERLAPIIETFDQVWYGYAPLDAARFQTYEQQVAALRRRERGGR